MLQLRSIVSSSGYERWVRTSTTPEVNGLHAGGERLQRRRRVKHLQPDTSMLNYRLR